MGLIERSNNSGNSQNQTFREVWQKIVRFDKPDRIPLIDIEMIPYEVLQRWHAEGLPIGMSVQDYLNLDRIEWVPLDFYPLPRFVNKVLEEGPNYRIEINDLGITTKVLKKNPNLVYNYLDHPVKNKNDWEKMKERYNPHNIRRYPKRWGEDLINYYNTTDHPIGLLIHPFFFRLGLYGMGLVRFLMTFYDNPELIHEMFDFWADFTIQLVAPLLERVRLDFVAIAEDMAYKHSTHISPKMYKKFWFPYQGRVVDFIKNHDVKVLSFWNSGNIEPLMPLLLEAGFNCFWPLESVAGMNAVKLRKKYGNKIILVGNIAKEALIRDKEAIKKEVYAKVPQLIETGGYIPTVDDEMPQEVPFENYVYYIELLRTLSRTYLP